MDFDNKMLVFGAVVFLLILIGLIVIIKQQKKEAFLNLINDDKVMAVLSEGHHSKSKLDGIVDVNDIGELEIAPHCSAYVCLRENPDADCCPKVMVLHNDEDNSMKMTLNKFLEGKYQPYMISSIKVKPNA